MCSLRVQNNIIQTEGTYPAGLWKTTYDGYFNDNVTFYQTAPVFTVPGSSGPDSSFDIAFLNNFDYKTVQWTGYFKAEYSGQYTFYTNSDDASFLWMGPTAVSGFTTSNAIVPNPGIHAPQERSGNITLSQGVYYPMRVMYGENLAGVALTVSYANNAKPKTSIWTGLLTYNQTSQYY